MIRRNISQAERDHQVVKWSLMAAAFALSIGTLAEVKLARTNEEGAKAVAESVTESQEGTLPRIAG
jgi:hypothetical protein